MRRFLANSLSSIAVFAAMHGSIHAGSDESIGFVRDVRPIFERHCYDCHGAETQKSGLRLDVKAAAFEGGDGYAPNIVPHEPGESSLIQFVRGDHPEIVMPPEGGRLSKTEIATLSAWVERGAVWPDGVDLVELVDKSDHWAFEPMTDAEAPAVKNARWSRNDVDRFILARLEREGLTPAPEADRLTWLRRVTLDLTGLPPTPEEIEAFLADRTDGAYERVVERLLASPRYGERWAQHWLDVVRYADTHGFEVNTERPHAWPYRDYVIEAFNRDLPYDRFIREQLAGDALDEGAATGFLVTSAVLLPGQIGKDDASKRLARQDELGEILVNTGEAFLGLSIGCARCHDHKFDPISIADYYSMQAFFAGVHYGDRPVHTPESEATFRKLKADLAQSREELEQFRPLANSGVERTPVDARANTERFAPVSAKQVRLVITKTNRLEPCIDELEVFDEAGANVALASRGAKAVASGSKVNPDRHELRFVNDGKYGNGSSWMSDETGKGWVGVEFAEEREVKRVVWGRDRDGEYRDRLAIEYRVEVANASGEWRVVADSSDRKAYDRDKESAPFALAHLGPEDRKKVEQLRAQKETIEDELREYVDGGRLIYAGTFERPEPMHVLYRGDPEQPKAEVRPAVPSSLGNLELPDTSTDRERRLALADWIARPEHPLTARVMVNRIWQGHFGLGLVETPNDFGRAGGDPSHPALLDWLAAEFVRTGWSIKQMHRLIVLSATYRQSSRITSAGRSKDADVRLLWRYPSRRIEAEAIRDSMLAVSGRLNLKMGGRGFDLFQSRGGVGGFPPVETFGPEGLRRMIYAHKVRMEREPVFGAFDCPDAGQSAPRRRQSTTPVQALNLFNSRFTIEEADAFAGRVESGDASGIREQVRRAYRLALGRDPDPTELHHAKKAVREHGLATLCRAIYNSNEFLFLP